MAEIPDEFAFARELQDAVLRRGAGDPDEALRIGDHRLQRGGPERVMVGIAPGVHHVALRIQLDDFGAQHAAQPVAVDVAADLVRLGGPVAVDEPDVVHVIHMDPGDLLHAPPVWERLRPERVHPVERRPVFVQRLSLDHLRLSRRSTGQRETGADDEGHAIQRPSIRYRFHQSFLLLNTPSISTIPYTNPTAHMRHTAAKEAMPPTSVAPP